MEPGKKIKNLLIRCAVVIIVVLAIVLLLRNKTPKTKTNTSGSNQISNEVSEETTDPAKSATSASSPKEEVIIKTGPAAFTIEPEPPKNPNDDKAR